MVTAAAIGKSDAQRGAALLAKPRMPLRLRPSVALSCTRAKAMGLYQVHANPAQWWASRQACNLAIWQLGNLATWQFGNLATWQFGNLAEPLILVSACDWHGAGRLCRALKHPFGNARHRLACMFDFRWQVCMLNFHLSLSWGGPSLYNRAPCCIGKIPPKTPLTILKICSKI